MRKGVGISSIKIEEIKIVHEIKGKKDEVIKSRKHQVLHLYLFNFLN